MTYHLLRVPSFNIRTRETCFNISLGETQTFRPQHMLLFAKDNMQGHQQERQETL